ncbi:hypothetical protein [Gracilibacillus sp. YIM 98692]|uniref:hypothetical protein n=1 Tax=Gracilibacillus sp. YIM 98692 TaxID=2663532 RepID=UPI0013D0BB56|nr:hypothetical protein [Gracilibacillus sp. YIM 98692]
MSTTLGKWLTLFITLTIMFTPILAYIDSMHREAVEVVLQEGAKKAAIEGYFTPGIIDDMKQELVDRYNFDESTINITATDTLQQRENHLAATIEVPRGPIFLFNVFNNGPDTIKKSTTIMSEYIN